MHKLNLSNCGQHHHVAVEAEIFKEYVLAADRGAITEHMTSYLAESSCDVATSDAYDDNMR